MKKLFCIITVFTFLLLCGCSANNPNVTAITENLSFIAEIDSNDEKFIFDVKISKEDDITFLVVSPERIKGTIFEYSGSKLKTNLGKLVYDLKISDLPKDSPIRLICEVFSNAKTRKDDVKLKNDEFFISGDTNTYSYKLYLGTTGLPLKITDSKTHKTVIISKATIT